MHAEIAADTVSGAMVVVEPLLPQRAAGEGVELCASSAPRKARQCQRDMALEHAGKAVAHLLRRLANRDRPRDVGRSVEILGARIEEVEGARFETLFGFRHRAVMNDRTV